MKAGRRENERLVLHSPVKIAAIDGSAKQFYESAHLEDVSDIGCRFSLRHLLQPGAIVALKPLGQASEDSSAESWRSFVVIWVRPASPRSTAGMRCLLEHELRDSGAPVEGRHPPAFR
jgi:PilZ domain-containing protein